jgi:hypothetical protein
VIQTHRAQYAGLTFGSDSRGFSHCSLSLDLVHNQHKGKEDQLNENQDGSSSPDERPEMEKKKDFQPDGDSVSER